MLHQSLSLAGKGLEVTNLPLLLDPSWCILSITAAIGKEHFSLLAAQFPWDCKEAELEERELERRMEGGGVERRGEQERVAEAAWPEHTDDAETASRQAQSCCWRRGWGQGQCISLSS